MRGDDEVIELLNEVLTAELTAVNQYFVHAKMCDNWGYERLASKIRDESIDEMKHAERLVERILYLEGVPNLQRLLPLHVGETVLEQLQLDLATRGRGDRPPQPGHRARRRARATTAPASCSPSMLVSEEDHADWLETQLEAIHQVGLERYLAEQISS